MQRAYTLVELTIVTGIVALLAVGGAIVLDRHPLSGSTAYAQLDAQLQAARSLAAADGDGATLAVVPLPGAGFRSSLFAGRPDTALVPASAPAVESQASISEASAGAPPFTIFVSSGGDFSAAPGAPSATRSEPPCPPSGELELAITVAAAGARTLDLPCRRAAAGTPVPLLTNSPAP